MKKLGFMACQGGFNLAQSLYQDILCHEDLLDRGISIDWIHSSELLFSNNEVKTVIQDFKKIDHLYIFQECEDPESKRTINDNFMALCTAIDAAYRSGYTSISIVLPLYPYSRQERRTSHEGITARLIANILESMPIQSLISFDLHHPAIEGFFNRVQIKHLKSLNFLANIIESNFFAKEKALLVAPDIGSMKRIAWLAEILNLDFIVLNKKRNTGVDKKIESLEILLGSLKEKKHAIIIDDMIGTGTTILEACRFLKTQANLEKIDIFTSFPLFNNQADKKFQKAYDEDLFHKVFVSNLIYRSEDWYKANPWCYLISFNDLLIDFIFNPNKKEDYFS